MIRDNKEILYLSDMESRIVDGAYRHDDTIASIVFPKEMKVIHKEAFKDCRNLLDVNMTSNGITIMESEAFMNCSKLVNLILSTKLISLSDRVFKNCTSLENLVIPDNVQYIGKEAFSNCKNLKRVVLGRGIITIAEDAFEDCDALMEVEYTGTFERWYNLDIESGNRDLICALKTHKYDHKSRKLRNRNQRREYE